MYLSIFLRNSLFVELIGVFESIDRCFEYLIATYKIDTVVNNDIIGRTFHETNTWNKRHQKGQKNII